MDLPSLLKSDCGIEVDPRKVVVVGYSAGGTLALLMVSLTALSLSSIIVFLEEAKPNAAKLTCASGLHVAKTLCDPGLLRVEVLRRPRVALTTAFPRQHPQLP